MKKGCGSGGTNGGKASTGYKVNWEPPPWILGRMGHGLCRGQGKSICAKLGLGGNEGQERAGLE